MSSEALPDLIADRTSHIVRIETSGTDNVASGDLVRQSVLQAFGCTCPATDATATNPAARRDCPVHGSARRRREPDEPVMRSQSTSWDEDPYDEYTNAERREGVQETLRTAAEFGRAFRSDLAGAVRRGQIARDQLKEAIQHAELSGGLTFTELGAAETALSAIQYSLRMLYAASNHIGDQEADRFQ